MLLSVSSTLKLNGLYHGTLLYKTTYASKYLSFKIVRSLLEILKNINTPFNFMKTAMTGLSSLKQYIHFLRADITPEAVQKVDGLKRIPSIDPPPLGCSDIVDTVIETLTRLHNEIYVSSPF
jgi:hypothetical protein